MSITSIVTALGVVWKLWPTVAKTIPSILTAIEAVSRSMNPPIPVSEMNIVEKVAWDSERKTFVIAAVRAFITRENVSDSQLNWAIETAMQIKAFFPEKVKAAQIQSVSRAPTL